MSRVRDDIDQLTARLTTPAAPPSTQPRLLTLLMGHLPVRAGLWRLPASRVLVPGAEAILVAREEDDSMVLECIGDCGCPDGEELLPRLPVESTCVLVPNSGAAPELIADLESDRVALVTGADQAAIVGAYRLLKNLEIAPGIEIEVVIAGQETDEARAAVERLSDATARHLARPIRFAGAIPRIDADTGLMQSRCVPRPTDGLLGIAREIRRGPERKRPPVPAVGNQRTVSAGLAAVNESVHAVYPAAQPERVPLAETAGEDQPPGDASVVVEEARLAPNIMLDVAPISSVPPSPSAAPSPERPVIEPGPVAVDSSLCRHVPGLCPLSVRCPGHEVVELARDDAGGLHLLLPPEAASRVPVVVSWTRRHQDLLTMAVPGLEWHADSEPVVHILGEVVDLLCDLRDSSWKPHLLVRVDLSTAADFTSVALARE